MAIQMGSVWDVAISGTDVNGHKVRFSFSMDGALTYAEAEAAMRLMVADAQAISGVAFEHVTLTRGFYEDDLGTSSEQGEDKSLFVFRADTYPVQRVFMAVPGCLASIMQPNLIDIDQTDADVAAFIAQCLACVVCISGEEVAAVESAYLSQRRSLKRPGRRAG